MIGLTEAARIECLLELERIANQELTAQPTLVYFQKNLYAIIEELEAIGHFLGPWEYDCEIEYWGGKSYMDPTAEDELLLRSEFPIGVRFAWKDYESLQKSVY